MLVGAQAMIEGGPTAEVIKVLEGSHRIVKFSAPLENVLPSVGEMPFSHIHEKLKNPDRYQNSLCQA